MVALGLSSHAPLPFDAKWCMKPDRLDAYLDEIADARTKHPNLQVYSGLEVDYIPGKISPLDFKDKLDYTVGSVHFVNDVWEIDNTYEVFYSGLISHFDGSIRGACAAYFALTRKMILESKPDIVGHMDKFKMHNRGDHFFKEDEPWYTREIDATLDVVADAGTIVEVNTRGLYMNRTDEAYPSAWVLEQVLKKKIPVTISSDAHHPDDLTNRFPETAALLLKIGFKKLRILLNGRWTDVAFDENGIISKGVTNYPMA